MKRTFMTDGSRTTGASTGPQHIEREFEPDPNSARHARQFVLESGWSDNEETNLRLATIVSEIVTNAILHARTPFRVRVSRNGAAIRVDVSDASTEMPMRRPYDLSEVTGRGLHIVDRLSDRWGVSKLPQGKTVWFELAEAAP